jgi:hypothetical protein
MSVSQLLFGFITVFKDERRGYFGGYLVLNQFGRPLEFHCTAPYRPNRPQEILYGASLDNYLCGEQIGHSLVSRAKQPVAVVLTDHLAVLSLGECIDTPVVYVAQNTDTAPAGHWQEVTVQRQRLFVPTQAAMSADEIVEILTHQANFHYFMEPFDRIRLAVDETQRAA